MGTVSQSIISINFWWLEASKPSEATVPEPWKLWKLLVLPIISKIFATKFMETIGFRAGSTAKT